MSRTHDTVKRRKLRVTIPEPNPSGLCQCGCGRLAPIATKSCSASGLIRGMPARFIPGHHRHLSPVPYLIEDHGFETPCHVWKRSIDGNGYGRVGSRPGQSTFAHVVAWESINGPVPNGLQLDHLCRVRSCVNPEHLEPVTGIENLRRGRVAKVSPDDVREIRRLYGNCPVTAIAARFGITTGQVWNIATRRFWKDIPD